MLTTFEVMEDIEYIQEKLAGIASALETFSSQERIFLAYILKEKAGVIHGFLDKYCPRQK